MLPANDNDLERYGPWAPSRDIAREFGLRFFFTGIECKNSHVSERYTSDGKCLSCKLQYTKERYSKDPEYFRAVARKWHHENRDKALSRMKRYANDNAETIKQRLDVYRSNNRERRTQYSREWYAKNKERAASYRKSRIEDYATHARNRRAALTANGGSHTKEDVADILRLQKYKCSECGTSVRSRQNRHVDHIMPIALGGSNARSNLQILCPPCNWSKNDLHPLELAKRKGRLL